jgi:ferric-dicitrate binding protein FerR (iron transport regulator)
MAIMAPELIPADRDHLEGDERERLMRFGLLVAQGRHDEAQEEAEDLWLEANDAHKRLYQGLSNALTAVCAREAGQRRGSREIARRTRKMLAPYPRRVIGLDLDALLESVDAFVLRGEGQILLLRQGGEGMRG